MTEHPAAPKTLALFPLHTLLIPEQRFDLQIFEPRYLQLVKTCLLDDSEFGVVLIREGQEVVRNSADIPQLFSVGVSAKIVDWGQTSTDLLSITVEGQRKFQLRGTEIDDNRLMRAHIDWLPDELKRPVPAHHQGLQELLAQLCQHPAVARLRLPQEIDARQLGWQLCHLLPLAKPLKVDLLAMADPLQRLDRLLPLIDELSEGREP